MAFGIPAKFVTEVAIPSPYIVQIIGDALDAAGFAGIYQVSETRFQARASMSLLSYGERIIVDFDPHQGVARLQSRCFWGVFDWGKNKQNIMNLKRRINRILNAQNPQMHQPRQVMQ